MEGNGDRLVHVPLLDPLVQLVWDLEGLFQCFLEGLYQCCYHLERYHHHRFHEPLLQADEALLQSQDRYLQHNVRDGLEGDKEEL